MGTKVENMSSEAEGNSSVVVFSSLTLLYLANYKEQNAELILLERSFDVKKQTSEGVSICHCTNVSCNFYVFYE